MTNYNPTGAYKPKSRAGKIALGVFIVACLVTLLIVVIVKA